MNSLSFLWKLIAFQRRRYAILCVIQIGVWLMLMVPGLIGQAFFDQLTHHARVPGGIAGLGIAFAFSEAALIALYFVNVTQETIANSTIASLLRRNLLQEVLGTAVEPLAGGSPAAAVSRFRDDVDEISGFLSLLTSAIGMGVFVAMGVAVMFSINARITAAVFVPLLVILLVAERAGSALEGYRIRSREATASLTGAIGEGFRAIEAFQAVGAEEHLARHISRLNRARKDAALREALFSQIVGSINAHSISLGTAGILLLAARAMRDGTFTVGNFALFTFYLGYITTIIGLVGSINVAYKKVKVSLARLAEMSPHSAPEDLVAHRPVFEEASSPLPLSRRTAKSTALLCIQGLTVKYGDTGCGVADCSFDIAPGALTVITGRTGSGKTTLLRAMLGLIPIERGLITRGKGTQDSISERFPPNSAAFTPQTPMLFSETIRENIQLGISADPEQFASVLHSAALESDLSEMVQGVDTVLGAHGGRLSGGQTQRVAIARMLIRDAELLVLDDPTSALDGDTERCICDSLRSDGRTLLIASTRSALLRRADHIVVLKDGRVEVQGSREDVLRTSQELRLLLQSDAA